MKSIVYLFFEKLCRPVLCLPKKNILTVKAPVPQGHVLVGRADGMGVVGKEGFWLARRVMGAMGECGHALCLAHFWERVFGGWRESG